MKFFKMENLYFVNNIARLDPGTSPIVEGCGCRVRLPWIYCAWESGATHADDSTIHRHSRRVSYRDTVWAVEKY